MNKNSLKKLVRLIFLVWGVFLYTSVSQPARADDPPYERSFYQVLDEVLDDFEFDLKKSEVRGIKDVSIRNISLSDNVPSTFKQQLESKLTEKLISGANANVIQCPACRGKKTKIVKGQVILSNAENNPLELIRSAKSAGVSHFLDVTFTYQASEMLLSLTTIAPDTGSVQWTKTYSSEKSRAELKRQGINPDQEETNKKTEYAPTTQFRLNVSYQNEPDFNGRTGCLGFGFRGVERYDNLHKEVGFELGLLKNISSLSSNPSLEARDSLYQNFNLSMLFVHAWNFFETQENYDDIRWSYFLAIGGTYTKGYLGALARTGFEWRFAKSWAAQANIGFRPKATTFINGAERAVSGAEYGMGVSLMF